MNPSLPTAPDRALCLLQTNHPRYVSAMAFDRDTLETIFDASSGACHRCGRTLELSHYGQRSDPAGWEIDATRPHPKSTVLLAACTACLRPPAPLPRRPRDALAFPAPTRIGYARTSSHH